MPRPEWTEAELRAWLRAAEANGLDPRALPPARLDVLLGERRTAARLRLHEGIGQPTTPPGEAA